MREGANGAWWLSQSSKLMRPDAVGLGGFDSHTLPPRTRARTRARTRTRGRAWHVRACRLELLALITIFAPSLASAQRLVPKPPISPKRAFFESTLVPGLGQSQLGRSTGLLFVTVEAIALTMYAKSRHDLAQARAFSRDSTPLTYLMDPATGLVQRDSVTGALRVATWSSTPYTDALLNARKVHVEDWVATLIFNHLLAGVDAFVAAHLWDLPAQVELRAIPRGLAVRAAFSW